jgi:hypothetical protein
MPYLLHHSDIVRGFCLDPCFSILKLLLISKELRKLSIRKVENIYIYIYPMGYDLYDKQFEKLRQTYFICNFSPI